MKRPTDLLSILTLTLPLVLIGSRTEAQVLTSHASVSYEGGRPMFTPEYVPSYSYWTAAYYGFPPRVYVPYVQDQFPYYGRPYGSPSDPWSWPAMAGYAAGVPTRYYAVVP